MVGCAGFRFTTNGRMVAGEPGAVELHRNVADQPRRVRGSGMASMSKRVLVVDPVWHSLDKTVAHLLDARMIPTGCATVEQAEEALSAHDSGDTFDAIVVERELPNCQGFDFPQHLLHRKGYQKSAIVLVSRHVDSEARRAAEAEGIKGWLLKPFRRDSLYTALAQALNGDTGLPRGLNIGASATQRPARVLVAEDNATNQKVARALLERLGHRAHTVANGREAVEAMREARYDIVFMDCQMPEMDGWEATAEIRKLERHTGRHTPVVALTASALIEDQQQCLARGMDDFLPKPIYKEQLAVMVNRWVPHPGEHNDQPKDLTEVATA